jgi:hypothetical protein
MAFFSFLTKKYGVNIHNLGIVTISVSSTLWSRSTCPLKDVVDFKNVSDGFVTKDFENSWICFDFNTLRIKPTHYSVRSRTKDNSCHLRHSLLNDRTMGRIELKLIVTRAI